MVGLSFGSDQLSEGSGFVDVTGVGQSVQLGPQGKRPGSV